MSWPPATLLRIGETPAKGRGLFIAETVEAGTPLLCEAALAAHSLEGLPANKPWQVAARLAAGLIDAKSAAVDAAVGTLEPRQLADAIIPDGEAGDIAAAAAALPDTVPIDERTRLLHVVARNALCLENHQALCPRASMVNHSCMPNATHQHFRRTRDGALCVCLRAVRPIQAGDEITISYIEDLACPPAERAQGLAHHRIICEARSCDPALEAWSIPPGEEYQARRSEAELTLHAHNVAADKTWAAAHATPPPDEAQRRQLLMEAAQRYAKILQLAGGTLGEGHALLLQARGRIAHVTNPSPSPSPNPNPTPTPSCGRHVAG